MASTSPARIDDELYASAKLVGEVMSRSAAQQVNHWARIGREVEAAAGTSTQGVAQVLAGRKPYDELTADEQAVVRALWVQRLEENRQSLDLAADFAAAGQTYAELDDEGNVVTIEAESPRHDAVVQVVSVPRSDLAHVVKVLTASLTAARSGTVVVRVPSESAMEELRAGLALLEDALAPPSNVSSGG